MADEQLEALKADLKRWGNAKVARRAANEDGPSAGDSVLARQRELGLRSRLKREKEHEIVGRAGEERRRYMAAKASSGARNDAERPGSATLKLSILPAWAVDPIPARNDAARPFDHEVARIDLVPDELHWIDRALAQMARSNPVREACIREEYCGVGTQRMKASQVERLYGGTFSVWMYRRELQLALEWMSAKRAA